MDDLVKELQQAALPDPHDEREVLHAELLRKAADEIDRLTAELAKHGTPEDSNNYCAILTVLGMEEEGDPVAEVRRLRKEVEALRGDALRYRWLRSHFEFDYCKGTCDYWRIVGESKTLSMDHQTLDAAIDADMNGKGAA